MEPYEVQRSPERKIEKKGEKCQVDPEGEKTRGGGGGGDSIKIDSTTTKRKREKKGLDFKI